MAKYSAIKAAVDAYIKQNGRKEITGRILNAVLNSAIDSLGKYFQFVGHISPETEIGENDQNVAYITGTPGTYSNIGGLTIAPGEICVLKYDGQWEKEILFTIPTKVSQFENDLGYITNSVADLIHYYSKDETFNRGEVYSLLESYYDKEEVDSIVSAISGTDYYLAWDGSAEPDVSKIPAGVVVTWNENQYVGTLLPSSDTKGGIYLVKNGAYYDMYITTEDGGFSWLFIGSTSIDLSGYATTSQLSHLSLHVNEIDEELHEINPHITGRMGIGDTNDDIDTSILPEYTDQYGIATIVFNTPGYLWVCLENDNFRVTSSGVEIPMVYVKESGNLHCYVSADKINAGAIQFVVEGIHPIKSDTERVVITARSYTLTYGDEMPEFGFIADGEVVGNPEITCEAVQGSDVGTYIIHISRGSVEDDNAIYVDGVLTIEKAELIVYADNKQVEVGGAMPEFTITYEGFVLGEDESVLTTPPTCTTTAEDTDTDGDYPITPSGAVAANYSFEYIPGVLRVGDPVIASYTGDEVFAGGNCGGYINTSTGKWAKDTYNRWYGTLIDVRKYKGCTIRLKKNPDWGVARYAFLTDPTFASGSTPSYVSGVDGVTDYNFTTHQTEYLDLIVPADANYLFLYTYSQNEIAPGLDIYANNPEVVLKNLTASLFSTKTTIGDDGRVYTGQQAENVVCSGYLDTTIYAIAKRFKMLLNHLPSGVDAIMVNVAEYLGNQKFIRRTGYRDLPTEFSLTPSTAYVRIMAVCKENGTQLEGNVIRFDNDDIQTEGQS